MDSKFLEIEVHGDGYERGYAHGNQLKDYIIPYFEKTPTKTVVSQTNQKYVSSANAFLETETKTLAIKTPEKDHERIGRYDVLDQYGTKLFPAGTLDEMRECLRHHGAPASICRHSNQDLSLTRESYIIQAGKNIQGMYVGERGFACQTKIDAYFKL